MVGPNAAANVRGLVRGISSCIIIKAQLVCTPFYFSCMYHIHMSIYVLYSRKERLLNYTILL